MASRWALPVTLVVVGSLAAWGAMDAEDPDALGPAIDAALFLFVLACMAGAGALLRSPAALILSLVPTLIAIPFGIPDDPDLYDPIPLWFGSFLWTPGWAWLLGAGALAGARRWRVLAFVVVVTAGIGGSLWFANEQGWM
jgi:hypothetical protein